MSDKTVIGLSKLIALRNEVDVIARNVANDSTVGFRRVGVQFREYVTQSKCSDETPHIPTRSLVAAAGFTDFSSGRLRATGGATDVAILGDGFFVVRTPAGDRYTRDGSFTLDPRGGLVSVAGHRVLTEPPSLQIMPSEGPVSIGSDGSIVSASGRVGRLRIVSFDLEKRISNQGGTLFDFNSQPVDVPANKVQLVSGALEGSNVNAAQEMSNLLAAARAYDNLARTVMREEDGAELRKLSDTDPSR